MTENGSDDNSRETAFTPVDLEPDNVELNPATVEGLENLDVYPALKEELLLILLGKKPATDYRVGSRVWQEGEQPETEIAEEQTSKDLVAWLDKSGLNYKVSPDEIIDPVAYLMSGSEGASMRQTGLYDFDALLAQHQRELRRVVWVGRTGEDVDKMEKAYKTNDSRLLGEAYGFPETAIDAYVAEDYIPPDQVDNYVKDSEVRAFLSYCLSWGNWQVELKLAGDWAAAVKAASPKIYDQIIAKV